MARRQWKALTIYVVLVSAAGVRASEPASVPPPPVYTIRPGPASGQTLPARHCWGRTGGGLIRVKQTAPDTLTITLTGVVVAGGIPMCSSNASIACNLSQCFEVVAEQVPAAPPVLLLDGRLVGLLRNPCHGTAGVDHACATIHADAPTGRVELGRLELKPVHVGDKENLSVYVHDGPVCLPAATGPCTVEVNFAIDAGQPKCRVISHTPVAEFSPSGLLAAWMTYKDPFQGVSKDDFGLQFTLRVVPAGTVVDEKILPRVGQAK